MLRYGAFVTYKSAFVLVRPCSDHGGLCVDLQKVGFCLELEKQDSTLAVGQEKQKGGASGTSNSGESGKVDH